MATKLNEQQQAVADYLESIGVKFSVILRGATKRDNWECDEWAPLFSRGSDREGRQIAQPYFAGIGHRKPTRPMPPDIARLGKNILARVEWEKRYLRPAEPCAADVLHCLLLDADCGEMTFRDWCNEFGYDTDSRKAFATHEQCCETAEKMRALFSREERDQLKTLLEDY